MKSSIVLLSGGMDSTTLLHYVKRELLVNDVRAISFNYGQKHSRELEMAVWQAHAAGAAAHTVVDISFLKHIASGSSALINDAVNVPAFSSLSDADRSQPPTYVPNRNLVLLSLAVAHAEATGIADVFYGAHAQDRYGYWDCTPEFVGNVNEVLALNRRLRVTVRAPFIEKTKTDILKLGLLMGIDYSRTWSCYKGAETPCGICPTCVERTDAFRAVDAPDPLVTRRP